jgi:hypothetical protein
MFINYSACNLFGPIKEPISVQLLSSVQIIKTVNTCDLQKVGYCLCRMFYKVSYMVFGTVFYHEPKTEPDIYDSFI